ncbi:hypothetical protein KIN20_023589 [Parelaphostrongylus tenuis]|uniref:Uncharacterized protein n=1 Tax=Parelaphostrongylus tenuis TaxID=148309 RepID=A0AAD5MRX7_PARTN|nr:hypothetical protein KIN20_023589 [Parelaphostrongylus tenuis]
MCLQRSILSATLSYSLVRTDIQMKHFLFFLEDSVIIRQLEYREFEENRLSSDCGFVHSTLPVLVLSDNLEASASKALTNLTRELRKDRLYHVQRQ